MVLEDEGLLRFKESLGKNVICTNDFANGTHCYNRNYALQHDYISLNQIVRKYLVFDIDRRDGGLAWEAIDVAPTIMTVNRHNGHAHFLYELIEPVIFSSKARQRPQSFFKALEHGMSLAMKADLAYTGLITKNPFSKKWLTVSRNHCRYTLEQLSEYCKPISPYTSLNEETEGIGGRNVAMFETIRRWAYKAVKEFQNESAWHSAVECRCQLHNGIYTDHLPQSEVRATANSIAKWTWRNRHRFGQQKNRGAAKIDPTLSLQTKQQLGADYTNKLRTATIQNKIKTAVTMLQEKEQKVSATAIATAAKVGRSTVYRHQNLWK